MRTLQHLVRACSLAVAGLALGVGPAWSAEVWLEARPLVGVEYPVGIPATVPMWGYASCGAAFVNCSPGAPTAAASVPGPQLVVPDGNTNGLTVHLRNSLPTGLTVPDMTSIVIPGQRDNLMAPVMFPPENSPHGAGQPDRVRMRSFTHETARGQTENYVWPTLKPGTYLYHSGTHAQVQVQMGLYGSVKADAAAGQAYAGQAYASEATLLFSEIDPALHLSVAGGGTLGSVVVPPYGTPPMTSTINYQPKYFLMNGAPYSASTLPIFAGNAGERVLLRLLNAGLESHVATLLGGHFQVIAEDGNALAHGRDQYETLLPAGKTMDAIWVPATSGIFSIYDRRNRQGMLAKLEVDGPPLLTSAPPLTALVNVPYPYTMTATTLHGPITYALRGANPTGLSIDGITGVVSWIPTVGQLGNQVVQLQATDARGLITEQNFTVVVNDGPPVLTSTPPLTAQVGVPYPYTMQATDANLPIAYALRGANPAGLTINSTTGVVSWTPIAAQAGNRVVQLQVADVGGLITEQNFTVLVIDTPPVITSTPPLTAQVGVPYPYTLQATDFGGPIDYETWGANPAGLTINITTGVVTWTPTLAQAGNRVVRLQAMDAANQVTEQNFTVLVIDTPPVITSTPPLTAQVGVPYLYTMHATDFGGPIFYEEWGTTNPTNFSINFNTGVVTWTPTAAQVGNRSIQLQATDAADQITEQNFTVVVSGGQPAPVITSTTATAVFRNLAGNANDRWTISGTAVSSSPCPATPSASCNLSLYRVRNGIQALIGTTTVVQANGTWSFVEIPATPGAIATDTVRVRLTQTNAILINNVPITIQTTVLP